jgi:drug/metabolite transporter (DMT)-like permease
MKDLNPYQVNFLMAIGMAVTALPALLITKRNLSIPVKSLPLGAPIGLLMALGSISYVLALAKMDVGTAAAILTSYIVLVVVLSRIFLSEHLDWIKIIGIALAVGGVALSIKQK